MEATPSTTALTTSDETVAAHVQREQWYRYSESAYSECSLMLALESFDVVRHTAAGVWLDLYGSERFVLRAARKRFACPTREEAYASFLARKRRQAKILCRQLHRAEAACMLQVDGGPVYY